MSFMDSINNDRILINFDSYSVGNLIDAKLKRVFAVFYFNK